MVAVVVIARVADMGKAWQWTLFPTVVKGATMVGDSAQSATGGVVPW